MTNCATIQVGGKVVDDDGYIGVVIEASDPHNIFVKYDNGGSGYYCIVPSCAEYDPLRLIDSTPQDSRNELTSNPEQLPH